MHSEEIVDSKIDFSVSLTVDERLALGLGCGFGNSNVVPGSQGVTRTLFFVSLVLMMIKLAHLAQSVDALIAYLP